MTKEIFSGEYSRRMWNQINDAESVEDLKYALYTVCCRLQELEDTVSLKCGICGKRTALVCTHCAKNYTGKG